MIDREPIRRNQKTCKHEAIRQLTKGRNWFQCDLCEVLIKDGKDGTPMPIGLNVNTYTRATMLQLAEEGTARILVRLNVDEHAAGRRLRTAGQKIGMPIRCHREEDGFGRLWIVGKEVQT